MGRRKDSPDFTRSNRLQAIAYTPTAEDHELSHRLVRSHRAAEREAIGQTLLSGICRRLRVEPPVLRVSDTHQPHRLRQGRLASKEYGMYRFDDHLILISNLTAVKGNAVAGKTFFDTLLHEFMHHLDRRLLRISSTPHSPGFYARIDDMKRKLLYASPKSTKREAMPWQPPPDDLSAAFELAAAEAARRAREKRPASIEETSYHDVPAERRRPRWTPPSGDGLFGERSHENPVLPAPLQKAAPRNRKPRPVPVPAPKKRGDKQLSLDFEEPLFSLDSDEEN